MNIFPEFPSNECMLFTIYILFKLTLQRESGVQHGDPLGTLILDIETMILEVKIKKFVPHLSEPSKYLEYDIIARSEE